MFVTNKCIGCGTCIIECPVGAISKGKDGKAVIDQNVCVHCGYCLSVCPVNAITAETPKGKK